MASRSLALVMTAFLTVLIPATAKSAPLSASAMRDLPDLLAGANAEAKGNFMTAAQYCAAAAAQNNAVAEGYLGQMYLVRQGVPQDCAKATQLMARSAAQGDVQSVYNFGVFFEQAQCGVPQDFAKAMLLFKAAAGSGMPTVSGEAETDIGDMYAHGYSVMRDQAAAWKPGLPLP